MGQVSLKNRLRKKWFNSILPNSLSHLKHVLPEISIRKSPDHRTLIFYKGELVCCTLPWSSLRDHAWSCLSLIGSGPSLNDMDLSQLNGQDAFLLNGAYQLTESVQFSSVMLVVIDMYFVLNHFDLIEKALRSGHRCAFSLECIYYICQKNPALLSLSQIYLIESAQGSLGFSLTHSELYKYAQTVPSIHMIAESTEAILGFSEDPACGLFDGGTVMYTALQIAYSCRPATVLLVGFDIGNSDGPRFNEKPGQVQKSGLLKDYHTKIEPSFSFAAPVFKKAGINLYNLSPISKLPYEVIPLGELSDFFHDRT